MHCSRGKVPCAYPIVLSIHTSILKNQANSSDLVLIRMHCPSCTHGPSMLIPTSSQATASVLRNEPHLS